MEKNSSLAALNKRVDSRGSYWWPKVVKKRRFGHDWGRASNCLLRSFRLSWGQSLIKKFSFDPASIAYLVLCV